MSDVDTAEGPCQAPPFTVVSDHDHESRAHRLFSLVAASIAIVRPTIWGEIRAIDGYHLALFALQRSALANDLLAKTLDTIETSIAFERSGRGDEWHLGDFALHTAWRAANTFESLIGEKRIEHIEQLCVTYPYHDGGLSENHNLLHHSMRHLAGRRFPDRAFADGRCGRRHGDEAGARILEWGETWLTEGSEEWGAALYLNVDIMALVNLFDYSPDGHVKATARLLLDRLALEHALGAHEGAYAGASRRGYSCYRMDARRNPSRALHHLWFGTSLECPAAPHFVGGVLCAALSRYRPPKAVELIARYQGPFTSSAWNTRRFWQPGVDIAEHFCVTTRYPGVQLSGMVIPGSPSRYTDFTWVAAVGSRAIVFANHPAPRLPGHQLGDSPPNAQALLDMYESGECVPGEDPLWVKGNMPPGQSGDYRPGYWQGHGAAPASWTGVGVTASLYTLADDCNYNFVHIYLATTDFEEVVHEGLWVHARELDAYLSLWGSAPATVMSRGVWANREWRMNGPEVGLVAFVGSRATHGSHAEFVSGVVATDPQFVRDYSGTPRLVLLNGSVVLTPRGANSEAHFPPRVRLSTPWGELSERRDRAADELQSLLERTLASLGGDTQTRVHAGRPGLPSHQHTRRENAT